VDLIVVAIALECVGLAAWLVHAGATRLVTPLLLHLASGALLLLALRASLAGAASAWIAAALLGSLATHLLSLRRSYRALLGPDGAPLQGRV
jgi:hypothetical protein